MQKELFLFPARQQSAVYEIVKEPFCKGLEILHTQQRIYRHRALWAAEQGIYLNLR